MAVIIGEIDQVSKEYVEWSSRIVPSAIFFNEVMEGERERSEGEVLAE